MSKLGKVLLFSVVFEITFAVLYFGHAADLIFSSLGTGSSSQVTSLVNQQAAGSGLEQFIAVIFSNPIALGIIWSGLNVMIIVRIAMRSKSEI